MKKIRAAVIGVGYLGRFHAQKFAQVPGCELVAVVDSRQEVRDAVGTEVAARGLADYRELLGSVDAVSVVTPTPAHFAIARDFLSAGAHVLVEKPITETVADATRLVDLARDHGKILQVGHIERFSAVGAPLAGLIDRPLFIQASRIGLTPGQGSTSRPSLRQRTRWNAKRSPRTSA